MYPVSGTANLWLLRATRQIIRCMLWIQLDKPMLDSSKEQAVPAVKFDQYLEYANHSIVGDGGAGNLRRQNQSK